MRVILIILISILLASCSGSKKYFKAAEKLEKQGLVNEAADYYLESLKRKPTNVQARIKLKEVGQKYVSSLASAFFRQFNTQELEASLETFERLKTFHGACAAFNVQLDYPSTYNDDYNRQVDIYCARNYNQAYMLVSQKKYGEAQNYILKVKKYHPDYRNLPQLEIVATCEPLYQSAISSLENKNYSGAYNLLASIRTKTENYKDMADLLELASAQQTKSFILFEPRPTGDRSVNAIEEYLYSNFSQIAQQKFSTVKVINNSPFQAARGATDLSAGGNVDLVEAIRKATGADFFYVYDVSNKKEHSSGLNKTTARCFEEVKTRKNDTLVITEYKPFDYNIVRANRTFSYDFRYKLINAYTNQVVSSGTEAIRSQDNIEYQEFHRPFGGNINTLYPYNPQQTAPLARYSPHNWRGLFSARNSLKSFDELRTEAMNKNLTLFGNSASVMR
jgi:hypothetical protein